MQEHRQNAEQSEHGAAGDSLAPPDAQMPRHWLRWSGMLTRFGPIRTALAAGVLCAAASMVGVAVFGQSFISPENMFPSLAMAAAFPMLLAPPITWMLSVLVKHVVEAEGQQRQLAEDLAASLREIKLLRGLLPVCASCKNVRNDAGEWFGLDRYIEEHSEMKISHGICPDCVRTLYPDIADRLEQRPQNEQ